MGFEHTARLRKWLEGIQAADPSERGKPVTSLEVGREYTPTIKALDFSAAATPQARWEASPVGTPGNQAGVELICRRNTLLDEIWTHIDETLFPGHEWFQMVVRPIAESLGMAAFTQAPAFFAPNPDMRDPNNAANPYRVHNTCHQDANMTPAPTSCPSFFAPPGPVAAGGAVPWSGGRWHFDPPIYVIAESVVQLVHGILDRPFPRTGFAWRELPTP